MKTRFSISAAAILLASLCVPALVAAEEKADGFVSIFDGESLKGWEGKKEFWSVEDGAITGRTTKENPTKGNTFLIWKDGELADFELHLKFRLENHNSGIQYRSTHRGDFVVGGYQADIAENDRFMGILYEEKGRGILAMRSTKVTITADGKKNVTGATDPSEKILGSLKKSGWNDYVIIAKGNHIVQKINGLTTCDVTDNQEDKRKMKGILALQLHAGPAMVVQFKDIKVKHLK